MPTLRQGDVFERLRENDMAIVFGHIGFNEMNIRWRAFKQTEATLSGVRDPFLEVPKNPICTSTGKWLWFIPERENHGMTDEELKDSLDRAISWSVTKGLKMIVTNGIRDVDHGTDTISNRNSEDQRVQFLNAYSADIEKKHTIKMELVSLNDAFVRNAPTRK